MPAGGPMLRHWEKRRVLFLFVLLPRVESVAVGAQHIATFPLDPVHLAEGQTAPPSEHDVSRVLDSAERMLILLVVIRHQRVFADHGVHQGCVRQPQKGVETSNFGEGSVYKVLVPH